jgi:hypothetical protein
MQGAVQGAAKHLHVTDDPAVVGLGLQPTGSHVELSIIRLGFGLDLKGLENTPV